MTVIDAVVSIIIYSPIYVLYSPKILQGIKFGGLVVHLYNHQTKIHQYFILACIRMTIPYRTGKFKSTNIFLQWWFGAQPPNLILSQWYFCQYDILGSTMESGCTRVSGHPLSWGYIRGGCFCKPEQDWRIYRQHRRVSADYRSWVSQLTATGETLQEDSTKSQGKVRERSKKKK